MRGHTSAKNDCRRIRLKSVGTNVMRTFPGHNEPMSRELRRCARHKVDECDVFQFLAYRNANGISCRYLLLITLCGVV